MRPRPKVHLVVATPPAVVKETVARQLEDSPLCSGGVGEECITLRVHPDRRRMWSPWLQLKLSEQGGATVLEGHMGPAPELWTGFVFIYSLAVAVFIGGSMYGLVQLNLGQSPTGLVAVAASLGVLAVSCGADLVGRRVGEGQMGVLRGFLERALPDATDVDRAA